MNKINYLIADAKQREKNKTKQKDKKHKKAAIYLNILS